VNREPEIVFCTTCKGRTQHIQQTLPKNLADNAGYRNCKFVVLDYCDAGELRAYLEANHQKDIVDGRLVVYRFTNEDGRFHISHAKNIAARCGILEGADILVTVDADNFTGPGFARFIADKFEEGASAPGMFLCPDFPLIKSLPYGPLRPQRGYAGRLAIRSMDFVKMGGYDEAFDTWRGEDIDMIARLRRVGYTMRHIDNRYLNTIPHNAEVRFKEYPHAKQYENNQEWKNIDARTVTVVNYGRFGVATVYRNFQPVPVELKPVPTRVFGIGMHKTGTTSLDKAFQILGFDSFHWGEGESPVIWNEMRMSGRSTMLERWYAFSDLPFPLLYKQLDKAYPGSRFILTIRDEQEWLKSVERLWDVRYNPTRWVWDKYPFTNRIHTELYGQRDFNAGVFLARYRRHNAEVMEYFKGADLLVMDVREGWLRLCGFLGKPIPDIPFPVGNPTRDLNETASVEQQHWIEAVAECYEPDGTKEQ
jgi:hypothetical protein